MRRPSSQQCGDGSRSNIALYPVSFHTTHLVGSRQNWFDEGTRNKVHVLGRDPGSELRKFIDNENIPKAYGGELAFNFEDEPNLDQAAKEAIGEMPKGPVIFGDGAVIKPHEGKFSG